MEFKFNVKGHENILGTHETTLEFTKDKELTKRGNCIIGVRADFDSEKLKDFVAINKNKKILVEISSGKENDYFVCFINKEFKSKDQMVFRTSDFISERTLGIKATKSSLELKRSLMDSIAKEGAVVLLKPIKHRCIIFDFDNTLQEFEISRSYGEHAVAKVVSKKFGYDENKVKKALQDIDLEFTEKGIEKKDSMMYDRIRWYKEYAKRNNLKIPDKEIKKLVDLYWKTITSKITAISGAYELLDELKKKNYILVLITDTDGERKLKMDRIKKLKMEKYFDIIITGDDTKTTKPDIKNYEYMLEHLNKGKKQNEIKYEECISIGDKPPADLSLAKPLGITTIWFKYGKWKKIITEKPAYVDFEANTLPEVGRLIEQM